MIEGESPFSKILKQLDGMTKDELAEFNRNAMERKRALEEQAYKEKLKRLYEICGLGEKFSTRTFDTFEINKDNKGAYEYCKKYALNFDKQTKGIYIWGGYGIGKTHLAAAIANYLLRQMRRVIFFEMTNFLGRINASYNDHSTGAIIRSITDQELVILDDFDKLKPSEKTVELLYGLINSLYEKERKVIITANRNRTDILSIYDGSIASRIAEMCDVREMHGEDWRPTL